jgi:hypothetical protein
MNFLLELPAWVGILIITSILTLVGLFFVINVKKLLESKITNQHEKVGRILFRVTAGLIALLVSLSYANERMEKNKIIESLDIEASLIVNLVVKLEILQTKEAEIIKENLKNYINYTINDQWKSIEANPFFSKTSNILIKTNKLIYELPVKDINESKLKSDMIEEINQINKLMQVRIYSQHTVTPYLIYILLFGLVLVWVFYSVYKLDFVSLLFLSLYNIFIAVLIYFIFMLSNPLIGPLKIDTPSFNIVKTKGFEMK